MARLKPYHGKHADIFFWLYVPSLIASIVSAILFAMVSIVHTWKTYNTRSWFTVPFLIGCYSMTIGFAARAASYNATDGLAAYLIQSILIVISPTLYAATIYMLFVRLIRRLDAAKHSVIRVTWLSWVFIGGDMISLNVLGIAASVVVIPGQAELGTALMLAGMLFQVIFFGIFVVTVGIFHSRLNRDTAIHVRSAGFDWIPTIRLLYFSSALILVRSVFRTIEFAQGDTGYTLRHEWTLYAFDVVPMFFVVAVFVRYFPGHIGHTKQDAASGPAGRPASEEMELVQRDEQRLSK